MRGGDIGRQIESLQGLMKTASAALDFETAIKLRDRIAELKKTRTRNKQEQKQIDAPPRGDPRAAV